MKANGHPLLFNVEFLHLQRFGHLFGTVKQAFEYVKTKFVFVTQHDLRLCGNFVAADVQNILDMLYNREDEKSLANYIVLNRDVNSAVRTRTYFRLQPERSIHLPDKRPSGFSLTGMAGFSDQAHFAVAEWYRQEVIAAIPPDQHLTCMEHILHEQWKESQEWRQTFLYGGMDEGPFVLDLIYGTQVYDVEGRLTKLPPPPSRPAS